MQNVFGGDLGSNTLRFVKIVRNGKDFDKKVCEQVVRTAYNLNKTGQISDNSIENIMGAFMHLKKSFIEPSVPMRCVATEAFRVAKNAKDVLLRIENEIGFVCEIISAKEEAELSSKGVDFGLKKLNIPQDSYVLIDFGGASIEFTCKQDSSIKSQSFPFGILTLANSCKNKKEIDAFLDDYLLKIKNFLASFKNIQTCIGIAGVPTTLGAYLRGIDYEHYEGEKISGSLLHVKDFQKAIDEFGLMSDKEREKWAGKGRCEVIEVGLYAYLKILQTIQKNHLLVLDEGLAEGVGVSLLS